MPTYQYLCENCGYEFEQFQLITAGALLKCPKCEKMSLKRLIGSGSGVIFKGSGFYQTDYRSPSYKTAEKTERETADTSKQKAESTKTESKDSKPTEKTKSKKRKEKTTD